MKQNNSQINDVPFAHNYYYNHYYYYSHFTTLCPGLPRWVGTRRINHSGFCWSRHDGVAVASAEPYASYLHFAPEDNHTSISSIRFLRAGCPTNSVKALKASVTMAHFTFFTMLYSHLSRGILLLSFPYETVDKVCRAYRSRTRWGHDVKRWRDGECREHSSETGRNMDRASPGVWAPTPLYTAYMAQMHGPVN